VQLAILHPEVAYRDCEHCQKWKYDEETGEVEMFGKVPMERPNPDLTPCRVKKAGCPKGTPEHQRSLTAQNHQAWLFHRECRAVRQWPDDPVVRANAAVIDLAEQMARDAKADRRMWELTEYVKLALKIR
jgi:hypothetical protein